MHAFVDEKGIAIPRGARALYSMLESSVHPVRAPNRGAFHPKVSSADSTRCLRPDAKVAAVRVEFTLRWRRRRNQPPTMLIEALNTTVMMRFEDCVGIDYSGAETPTSSLKGLRVYVAEGGSLPKEALPPPSRKKYWTRRGIAEWLRMRLGDASRTLVGVDHGFSFPLRCFETHRLEPDWASFLDDFQLHWPTDGGRVYVDFVRNGSVGNGAARGGKRRWRRLTEERAGSAKSVFHFDVQGQVAKSTHAGIPWLRYLRRELGDQVHFWPFDGWDIPNGRSAVAEVYPSLWSGIFYAQ